MPRFWHGGRRAVTIFFNNLSIFFPEGERFFIRSVKSHVGNILSKLHLADRTQAAVLAWRTGLVKPE